MQHLPRLTSFVAEFRGPGVHHNYEDSDSGYELDGENKGKPFGTGGYRGRIIFLGDGTEVLTDSDDTEMFDNADEDKDLESQVTKTSDSSSATTAVTAADDKTDHETKQTTSTEAGKDAEAKEAQAEEAKPAVGDVKKE